MKPGSRENKFEKLPDGSIRIKIKAQPIEGKANEALIEFLAGYYDVSKSSVTILKGHNSKIKRIQVIK